MDGAMIASLSNNYSAAAFRKQKSKGVMQLDQFFFFFLHSHGCLQGLSFQCPMPKIELAHLYANRYK
jgi:hypothetical protein